MPFRQGEVDVAVFISYASKDAAVATSLVAALERGGLVCWIAPRDVKAGALYAEAIIRAISSARALVLVLSQSAIASAHVGKEIERASSKRLPIIALRIDAAPLTPAFEYFLSESQWVEAAAGHVEATYGKLTEAILDAERSDPRWLGAATGLGAGSPSGAPAVPRRNRIAFAAAVGVVALAVVLALSTAVWHSKHAPLEAQLPAAAATLAAPTPTPAASAVSDKSIAVLPFTDMSEKQDQGYFSDGLSEDLINLLAKVPELQVPARASSFYFQGQHVTIAEIAKALSVAYVLEGSVSKAGDTIRVRTELIRAANGYDVWSESYDRELRDIFKVQDEIAGRVVTALRAALPATQPVRDGHTTNNPEAYNQYLLGRALQLREDIPGFQNALKAYRKAIALDPNYPDAYVGLAYAEVRLGDDLGDPTGTARALSAAEHAIALAPNAAAGYASRAFLRAYYLWDWEGARQDIDHARTLDPSAQVDNVAAGLVEAEGRLTDSIALRTRLTQRDPLVPLNWVMLGVSLFDANRSAEARAAYERALEINPDFSPARIALAELELYAGHPERALVQAQADPARQYQLLGTALAEFSLHHPHESQQALDELIRTEASAMAYQIAEIYAWRGEKDLAFTWLDRAYAQKDAGLPNLKADLILASLRTDPRFGALLRKMKLPL